jgi:hypothetical protein
VKCFTHELPPVSHHALFHIRTVPWYSGMNCFTQEIVPGNPVCNALHKSWFQLSQSNFLHSIWQLVPLYVGFKQCITHTHTHARARTHTHTDMLQKCDCTRTAIAIFIIQLRDKEVRRLDTVCSKSITGVFEAVNSSTKVVQFFLLQCNRRDARSEILYGNRFEWLKCFQAIEFTQIAQPYIRQCEKRK